MSVSQQALPNERCKDKVIFLVLQYLTKVSNIGEKN